MSDKSTAEEQSFLRVLGRWDVFAVAFGAMIGFGWIVLTGDFLEGAGTLGAVLAFAIGTAIMALVGLTYAELVSAMPRAGGEHNYVLRGMGSRPAFVASWSLVLGYVSVVAFEAVALPQTLLYLAPDLQAGRLWTVAGYEVYAGWVAVGVIGAVLVTVINYLGVRPAAVFQSIAVLFLLAVGVLLVVGTAIGGQPENLQPLLSGGVGGVIGVLVAVPFLYVGFDVIPQSAEEINLPYRRIGKLVVVAVAAAGAWYVMIMVTVAAPILAPDRRWRRPAAACAHAVNTDGAYDARGGYLRGGDVYRKIMLTHDGSELAALAVPHAVTLAKAAQAPVVVVQAVDSVAQLMTRMTPMVEPVPSGELSSWPRRSIPPCLRM